MGKLYHAMGPAYEQKAVHAFELNLRRKEEEMVNDKELGECLLYLSRYYKKVGEIDKAIDLARRLSDLQGVEKDEANKLLQELNLVS
jgi:lipopolysaccharide biosynthesis regulator YciM